MKSRSVLHRRCAVKVSSPEPEPPKPVELSQAGWHFACQPEDFDFLRILRDAPAAARVVRVRVMGREIVAYRSEAYDLALKALGGRRIGIHTWRCSSYWIRAGFVEVYQVPVNTGWVVTDALPFHISPYDRIVKWFADADAAERKAREEAERKAQRVEVSVTTT